MVSSEENSPHDEDNSRDEIETTQYPWYIREFKKLQPGHRFKMLVLLGLGAGIIYLFFQWFGWYFLLGLIPAPAWYFWALRQIDRESYTLIEIKIKGDEVNGKRMEDTQTNIYQIPPDVWKEIKKKGNPYTVGHRLYVCERFDNDEEGDKIIHFSEDPRLSNLTFFAKVKLWLDLKKSLPVLEEELAISKYHLKTESTRKAVMMLSKMQVIEENIIKPVVTHRYHKEVEPSGKML